MTSKIRVVVYHAQANYSRIVELETWTTGGGATPTPTPNMTPTPNPTPSVTPTPPPAAHTNVAAAGNGAYASASSELNNAYAVIDGVRNWATSGAWKDATPGGFPDWLQVDFNGPKTISEIRIYAVRDDYANPADPTENTTVSLFGITHFDVQYWNGSNWTNVPGGGIAGTNRALTSVTFAPVTTTRIRVVVHHAQDGFSRIVELEAWGTSQSYSSVREEAGAEAGVFSTAWAKLSSFFNFG
jgi:hypothetical protein